MTPKNPHNISVRIKKRYRTIRQSKLTFQIFIFCMLLVGTAITIFPFFWMVLTSFMTPEEVTQFPPPFPGRLELFPPSIPLDNYIEAWQSAPFGMYFFNSFFVGIISTLGILITSALAAFAFARLNFIGKGLFFFLVLGTMMIPGQVLLIPNYIILQRTESFNVIYEQLFLVITGSEQFFNDYFVTTRLWNFIKFGLDSYFALIFPWLANVFTIFLMRQFFKTIPIDLFDAAYIDGASKLRTLFQIVVPLSKPVFITAALFSFMAQWNSLLWPLIVTTSDYMRTLMVGLQTFNMEAGQEFELLMAATTLSILPILILFFFLQRYFVQGIVRSGLKS